MLIGITAVFFKALKLLFFVDKRQISPAFTAYGKDLFAAIGKYAKL